VRGVNGFPRPAKSFTPQVECQERRENKGTETPSSVFYFLGGVGVWGLGFGGQGLGLRVLGLGFGV